MLLEQTARRSADAPAFPPTLEHCGRTWSPSGRLAKIMAADGQLGDGKVIAHYTSRGRDGFTLECWISADGKVRP